MYLFQDLIPNMAVKSSLRQNSYLLRWLVVVVYQAVLNGRDGVDLVLSGAKQE